MPNAPYDVYINGKGYCIKEGSYLAGKQEVASEQFRTGDVSYENLSNQQAWAQSDWRGGFDQTFDTDRLKFGSSDSVVVREREGSFELTDYFSATMNFPVEVGWGVKERIKQNWFHSVNSMVYYNVVNSAANLSADGIVDMIGFADKLYVTNTASQVLWSVTAASATVRTAWSAELSGTGSTYADMAVLGDSLYITNGAQVLRKYDGVATSNVIVSNQYNILNLVEYNGRIYMGCQDRNNTNRFALRVYDGSTDWTVYQWENIDNGFGSGSFSIMISFNGKMFFNIDGYEGKTQIMSWNGDSISEEMVLPKTDPLGVGMISLGGTEDFLNVSDAVVSNGNLYILVNYRLDPISTSKSYIYCNPGNYWYLLKTINPNAVATIGGTMFTTDDELDVIFDTVSNVSAARYTQVSSRVESTGRLISSIIDMDLFSLNKKVSTMEVYHASLPVSAAVQATLFTYANTSSMNRTSSILNSTVGSNMTILKMNDSVGLNFKYQVVLSAMGGTTGNPFINDVVLRYTILPEFKKQWQFKVLVTDNLELGDGSHETRTVDELRSDLEYAASLSLTTFTDVDGSVYDISQSDPSNRGVIVQNVKFEGPYDFAEEGAEYIATVTLTQT